MSQKSMSKTELSLEQREELLRTLKARFEKNLNRRKGLEWTKGPGKAANQSRKAVVAQ